MMLAFSRRLPQAFENQRGKRAWPYLPLRGESKLLNGQTVLLVGYGSIARRLAELLQPLNMQIIGFRRNPTGDENGVGLLPIAQLDQWLPKADHVVNMLPASEKLMNSSMPTASRKYAAARSTTTSGRNDQRRACTASGIANRRIDGRVCRCVLRRTASAASCIVDDAPLFHYPSHRRRTRERVRPAR